MNPLANPNMPYIDTSMVSNVNNPFNTAQFTPQMAFPTKLFSGFPAMPDTDLNMIAQQQRVTPRQISTGSTHGAQNISGTQAVTDNSGNVRIVMGYQPGGF